MGNACAKTLAAGSWVGSWASSQQIPEPQNALPPEALRDATLRQIVHLTVGGKTLRVRLSNAFGTAPLTILGVLNAGTGGNRLLLDGLGPNALARFDRDVLAQAGVRYLIVLEGINDLGTATRLAPISAARGARPRADPGRCSCLRGSR